MNSSHSSEPSSWKSIWRNSEFYFLVHFAKDSVSSFISIQKGQADEPSLQEVGASRCKINFWITRDFQSFIFPFLECSRNISVRSLRISWPIRSHVFSSLPLSLSVKSPGQYGTQQFNFMLIDVWFLRHGWRHSAACAGMAEFALYSTLNPQGFGSGQLAPLPTISCFCVAGRYHLSTFTVKLTSLQWWAA